MTQRFRRLLAVFLGLAALVLVFLLISMRGYQFRSVSASFTETAAYLPNPDRGFYDVHAFTIRPEPQTFEMKDIPKNEANRLSQIQVNLRNFRFGAISEIGMQNITALFEELAKKDARYILRFLYDWNGKANETEPEELEIILTHMRQLSPLLKAYDNCIFLVQGLFIGNWGEMNGTPYTVPDSMKTLAGELLCLTGERTFLSVRTPAHWRTIIQLADVEKMQSNPSALRIGLFNDGIMGNTGDCGTYVGSETAKNDTPFSSWCREDELAFQNQLCRMVPNGGEVILDNPLNDFENAVQTLQTMHVTYLNSEYDQQVLTKWAAATVSDGSCYDGMDGLTYIERHLGYRYLLDGAKLDYSYLRNRLSLTAFMKNVGFAPVYTEMPITVTLVSDAETISLTPDGDLRQAAGGTQWEEQLPICAEIALPNLKQTKYDVYIQIWDPIIDAPLELANEQQGMEYGYYLGSFRFERVSWYEDLISILGA